MDEGADPRRPEGDGASDGRSGLIGKNTRRRSRLRLAVASIPLAAAAVLWALTTGDGSGPDSSAAADGPAVDAVTPSAVAAVQRPATEAAAGEAVGEAVGGAGPDSARTAAEGAALPDPPPGHRSVAVRLASPDAAHLVRAGDRVDVVGPDASVLAASLPVVQDRSTDQATVLVLAVPEDDAPRLAAAAIGPGLTVVLVPDPAGP